MTFAHSAACSEEGCCADTVAVAASRMATALSTLSVTIVGLLVPSRALGSGCLVHPPGDKEMHSPQCGNQEQHEQGDHADLPGLALLPQAQDDDRQRYVDHREQ